MVHVPAKFRENTAMRVRVTVRKLNVTDRQTDRGCFNISHPGPSAGQEIRKYSNVCSNYSAKTKRGAQTEGRGCFNISRPGPSAGDNDLLNVLRPPFCTLTTHLLTIG